MYTTMNSGLSVLHPTQNPQGPGPSATQPLERRVAVDPLASPANFKQQAYAALKNAIAAMDIYGSRSEIRLDERRLAADFGISRTPVREAMAQLEREGFVRSEPRRGVYVVRKNRREVIELITAWAALESMAARLITQIATDEEIASLRRMFATFHGGEQDRADRSIRDHMHIIEALEARDTARAESLVRDHALGLADHVAKYADYLD